MKWESCRWSMAGVAVALVALVPAASVAAPVAKPKKCSAGKVLVRVNGKPRCIRASTLATGAPGTNASDMLIQTTARKSLWPRKANPAVYKALGKYSQGVLAFDRALYAASRAVGAPFVPHDPAPAAAKRRDETLGLQIPAPVQWLLEKAERRQGGSEAASGVQTKEAVTTGKVMKPSESGTGDYTMKVSEKFTGDPCPNKDGVVEGRATYVVEREASFPFSGAVNVATIIVTFKAKVDKSAKITSYDVTSTLESPSGGWRGKIAGKKLVPGKIPTSELSGFSVSGTSGLSATAEGQLAAAVRNALRQAKEDVDRWLEESEAIFRDRAKCMKVKGSGLSKLKPGEQREVEVDVSSIRGPRTDDEVQVTGRNGLEIVSPTGKAKATDGKLKVKVRGSGGQKLFGPNAQPYFLDVESVSELGRGVGNLKIPRADDFELDFSSEITYTDTGPPPPENQTRASYVTSRVRVRGLPLNHANTWTNQAPLDYWSFVVSYVGRRDPGCIWTTRVDRPFMAKLDPISDSDWQGSSPPRISMWVDVGLAAEIRHEAPCHPENVGYFWSYEIGVLHGSLSWTIEDWEFVGQSIFAQKTYTATAAATGGFVTEHTTFTLRLSE